MTTFKRNSNRSALRRASIVERDGFPVAVLMSYQEYEKPSQERALESYMAELDRRGYTGTTRRRKTSSIKSFFGFLRQYGYITNNVGERLIPPAREYKEPRVLTTGEYQALLRACGHDIRDAAIIELLL